MHDSLQSGFSLAPCDVSVRTLFLCVYLEIGAVVLGDKGAVTLAEDSDLLLDVLNLVLGLLQVDDLDGHHLFSAVIDAFVDFTE